MDNNDLINKCFFNQLVDIFKKNNFDYIEKAMMIDYILNLEREKLGIKEKNKNNEGRIADIVAKKIGLSGRKELYRIRKILDANNNTIEKLESGKISGDKVSRIVYNLKDKTKEDIIVNKAIEENLSSNQIEKIVAEENDIKKVSVHLISDLNNVIRILERYDKDTLKDVSKIKIIEINGLCYKLKKILDNFFNNNNNN